MTKFEQMKNKMEVLSEIYDSLISSRGLYNDWANDEEYSNEFRTRYANMTAVYDEVIALLEKTYLK